MNLSTSRVSSTCTPCSGAVSRRAFYLIQSSGRQCFLYVKMVYCTQHMHIHAVHYPDYGIAYSTLQLTKSFSSQLLCHFQSLLDLGCRHGEHVGVRVGDCPTGVGGVGEKVARGPEKLHPRLLLQLEGKVRHLVQVLVCLLQSLSHGRNIPEKVGVVRE